MLLAVALAVSGCTGSSGHSAGHGSTPGTAGALPIAPDDAAKVQRLRALPFTASSVEVVAEELRAAGVGLYADTDGTGSEPVRLQQWQVRNLAVEAANGGGVHGSTLTALGGRPDGAPPVSYLIAAWVSRHPSPAAGFARAVLGPQDWQHAEDVVFPKLVLTLFTADLAKAAASPAGRLVPSADYQYDGPCTAVSSFIDHAISDLARLLKVDTSGGGLLGFLGGLWNIAVDLAAGVVKGLVRAFSAAILAPLIDVFALIGTIDQIVSYLVTWRVVPNKLPSATTFGIAPAVVTGAVEITVTDNQNELPPVVRDCANHFVPGFDKIGSAVDAPVTWTDVPHGRADLAHRISADEKVSDQHAARLTYQTGQEPPDATGDLVSEPYEVSAAVRRHDLSPLRTLMQRLVTDNLPQPIADVVLGLAGKVYTAAEQLFDDLTSVKAEHVLVDVSYHATTSSRPTSPVASPPAHVAGGIPTRCPAGSWIGELAHVTFDLAEVNNLPREDPWIKGCVYMSSKITIALEYGTFHPPADPRQPGYAYTAEDLRGAGAEPVTVPGAEYAWYTPKGAGDENVSIAIGNRYLKVGCTCGDGRQRAVEVATALIADPDRGPFLN